MSYDYNNLNVGKLDYTSIKSNLVSFLKKYPKFSNFDFDNEASSISLFLDILSANTAYNGYYLHSVLTNSFPYTASTKRLLLLNANLEAIPVTGTNTITVNMVGGKSFTTLSNFNSQTKTLDLPLNYDPTAVLFSTINDSTFDETYWTRVDSYTTSTATKIFTVINGPSSYLVTTNIAGAETPSRVVKVYAIESSGSEGNSATILTTQSFAGLSITNQTQATGGRDASSVSFLKSYVPYVSATKDRVVTQTDYVDAVYLFLTSKGLTVDKSTISITSPAPGQVKIYVPSLTSASIKNELITSYLATRKMAGISLSYGA